MPEPLFPVGRDRSGPDDHAEAVLRRVLDAEAAAVRPGAAPRVGDLVGRSAPRRWPTALGVAAAVAALAVTSAVALRPDEVPVPVAGPSQTPATSPSTEQTAAPSAPPSTIPSTAPSTAPSAAPTSPLPSSAPAPSPTGSDLGGQVTSVVLWSCLAEGDGTDPRVAPERRSATLPAGTGMTAGEATISAAVDLLDSSPPLDPDYVSYWALEPQDAPAPGRADVRVSGTGTTVDFRGTVPTGLAAGATVTCLTETLVRTVVSNGGTAPVTLLVDGEPAAFAELDLSDPLSPDTALLTGGWILDPFEGQRLRAGTVTLSGTATAFEATVQWRVLDADGAVAAEGSTQAGANGEYGPWTVPVDVSPGTYRAELWAEDMSGERTRLWEDTKTFTVVR